MKNDDYGFYGKGLDGYVHYRQGMNEAARNAPPASGGRRPPAAPQPTNEPAKSAEPTESVPIGTWIKRNPLHMACLISWFIALTCAIVQDANDVSIQFMTATAVFCAVALILLGIEIVRFVIWFFTHC